MKNQGIPPAVTLFAIAALVAAGMLLMWARGNDPQPAEAAQPTGTIWPDDGSASPMVVTPEAVTERPQLRLELDLPELDPDQAYWLQKARVVAVCPLCASVDQPAIEVDPNTLTVWLALLWTESRYQPWVESDIGCCYGLGQLGFSLRTAETDASPELNLYVSLQEFARLVEANDGDLMESVRNYKGVTTWDTESQANSVWSYIRIGQ